MALSNLKKNVETDKSEAVPNDIAIYILAHFYNVSFKKLKISLKFWKRKSF